MIIIQEPINGETKLYLYTHQRLRFSSGSGFTRKKKTKIYLLYICIYIYICICVKYIYIHDVCLLLMKDHSVPSTCNKNGSPSFAKASHSLMELRKQRKCIWNCINKGSLYMWENSMRKFENGINVLKSSKVLIKKRRSFKMSINSQWRPPDAGYTCMVSDRTSQ